MAIRPLSPAQAARLREVFEYDPSTGVFTVKVSTAQCVKVGDVAGSLSQSGYWYINVDNVRYGAHRVAWLFVHGEYPDREVDHRDGVKSHNWIDNLRLATHAENLQNLKTHRRDNIVGVMGVSPDGKKFRAQIKHAGKVVYLGSFADPKEAGAAYLKAKAEFHPFSTLAAA